MATRVAIKALPRRGADVQWSVEWQHINGEKSSNSWQTWKPEYLWKHSRRKREKGRRRRRKRERETETWSRSLPRTLLSEICLRGDKGPRDELLFRLISPGSGPAGFRLGWKTPQNDACGTFSRFQSLFVRGDRTWEATMISVQRHAENRTSHT